MTPDNSANLNPPGGSKLMRFFPRNWISQAGLMLAVVAIGNIVIFTIIDFISSKDHPYVGILAYMVAPGFLIFSLVLIGFGYWRDRQRTAKGEPPYPRV